MVKCTKRQTRQLKTALHWNIPDQQLQRIGMVLLREGNMTQPAIAEAMGVSLSTVNRAHMAYDRGGTNAAMSDVGMSVFKHCGRGSLSLTKNEFHMVAPTFRTPLIGTPT